MADRPRILGPRPSRPREQFANGSTHGRDAYMDRPDRDAAERFALSELRKVAAIHGYLVETDTVKVDWVFAKVTMILGEDLPETEPRREQDLDWNMARLTITAWATRSGVR